MIFIKIFGKLHPRAFQFGAAGRENNAVPHLRHRFWIIAAEFKIMRLLIEYIGRIDKIGVGKERDKAIAALYNEMEPYFYDCDLDSQERPAIMEGELNPAAAQS